MYWLLVPTKTRICYVYESWRNRDCSVRAKFNQILWSENLKWDAAAWVDIKLRGYDNLVDGVIHWSPSSTDEQNCKIMIMAAVILGSSHILIKGYLNYLGYDCDLFAINGIQQEHAFIENFEE